MNLHIVHLFYILYTLININVKYEEEEEEDDDGGGSLMVPPFPLLQSLLGVLLCFLFSFSFLSCTWVSPVRLKHGSVDINSSSNSNQSGEGDLIKRYPSEKHDFPWT